MRNFFNLPQAGFGAKGKRWSPRIGVSTGRITRSRRSDNTETPFCATNASTADAGTGIHMDLPDGYISIDSVAGQKGVITHFAVAVGHMDRVAAKRLADKINSELPDAKARDAYQANTSGSTVNLRDPDGFFVQISSKDGR